MISPAAAALNAGSAPHARAAADETGPAEGRTGRGATLAGAAAAGTAAASAATESRPVLGAARAGSGDGARTATLGTASPDALVPANAATAQHAAITVASTSRLLGIR